MLTNEELASELARYTYRPGWRLVFQVDPIEGPVLWVLAEVVDGYNQDRTVPLRIRSLIPPMGSANDLRGWLSWRLRQIESHESREMLRYDGELVCDPHNVNEIEA